ncbi:type III secretion system gatekeeper subunit SctW [Bordetella genomosp. 13]|uniref:SepL/TyeA/HrpJ family type III secretion system gatekeeper n=1 Tax=Bordetella genomosp. 13 TaxID=463040 RepID=A0A1W6Z832_9BORD|nr:type III secretion system gatekeeper subunit SctW [Bordetella genomosp. 13]ARP93556.1 SepL/TyeA/HrpJ family type III secretion system gatekeeper [Bordetella genomosp. 13]
MNRIDGSLPQGFSSLTSQADAGHAQSRAGTLMGEKTVALQGEISLGDAAEELSLHMAEKTEDKHHAERKVKADKPPELLDTSEIVDALAHGKDGDAQEKLEELLKKLMSGQGSPRQLAGQAFGDISQQYLGLQYALRQGERDGADPELLEAIRDALADMEIESGPEIRAGLNSLETAGQFADDAAGVARFQGAYRDLVLGEQSLGKTLDMALERFGSEDVARGLAQLTAALGHDLAAARPSTDANRLQALVSDLYQLEVAATVLENCNELADKVQKATGNRPDATRLMRDLVAVSGEKWVSESRFSGIAAQHGVVSLEGRIVFLTGIKSMLREMPVQIFPDPDTRLSIINASQEALDIAIDEEDQQ